MRASGWALTTAAIGSALASSCCLLPLALVSIGLTGAWLGRLRLLQPYSPFLLGISLAALIAAAYNGIPKRPMYRAAYGAIAALTLILLLMPVIAPWLY
jgi:mercuric ion transport protein